MNGNQCPYERDPRGLPCPFCRVRTPWEVSSLGSGTGLSPEPACAGNRISDLQKYEKDVSVVLFCPVSPKVNARPLGGCVVTAPARERRSWCGWARPGHLGLPLPMPSTVPGTCHC